MENAQQIFLLIACFAAVFIAIRLFFSPLRFLIKFAINTLLGFVGLALFNMLGNTIGFTIGFNIVNAAIVGTLGLPGFVLLLFSRVLLI